MDLPIEETQQDRLIYRLENMTPLETSRNLYIMIILLYSIYILEKYRYLFD